MSKKANFFAIGVFVVSASLIAFMILIFFGSTKFRKHTTSLLVTFQGSTNGLMVGSKVKTYGVEIGTVKQIMIHKLPDSDEVVIPVLIEIDITHLSNLLGYRSTVDFDEQAFQSMLSSGACAKLQMESIVTGLLYVEIELGSKEEGYILTSDRFRSYHSLPTVPTELEVMIASMQQIVTNLGSTDFRSLIEESTGTIEDFRNDLHDVDLKGIETNLNSLLTEARAVVNKPELSRSIEELNSVLTSLNEMMASMSKEEGGLLVRFDQALRQLDGTLIELELASGHVREWLDPSNSVYQEVVSALDQMSDVSRALRILLEYAERNPNAFITGRSREESPQ